MTNVTTAIEYAISQTGDVYRKGDKFVTSYFDKRVKAWRESEHNAYFLCLEALRVHRVRLAVDFIFNNPEMSLDAETAFLRNPDQDWKRFVRDFVRRF